MARLPDLERFSRRHGIPVIRVADLVRRRLRTEGDLEEVARPRLPTARGEFRAHAFRLRDTGEEHVALVLADVADGGPVLARLHSQCLTGDVFGSQRCDCGGQLAAALDAIAHERRGVLVYLMQEGRGIGLANKLRAYELQESGRDTVEANHQLGFPADAREYGLAARMLRRLGVASVRLMTNNPAKERGLAAHGVEVAERLPLEIPPHDSARSYLRTKRDKLGHLLGGL